MSAFKLIVLDPNHLVLTTERTMSHEEVRRISEAFARWKEQGGVAVLGDCVLEHANAVEIELDLPVEDGVTDEASDEFVRSHGGK